MRSILFVATVTWALSGCSSCHPHRPASSGKIDVHTHCSPSSMPKLLALMDAHGIERSVDLSGGWPKAGLEQVLDAAGKTNGRIVVFANVPLSRIDQTDQLVTELEQAHSMGAKGLKFFKTLGLGARDSSGALISVDDPRLDAIFEAAGRLHMPIAIHTGDPIAFWEPIDEKNERIDELKAHPSWGYATKDVPSWSALFEAFERRVARHPNTLIIGVHFGNAPELPERVAAMLEKYPNYRVDTAARVPELGRKDLRDMFLRYQDRILFGTDLQVGDGPGAVLYGSGGNEPATKEDEQRFFDSTWRYFETRDRGFESPTPIQGRWTINGLGLPPEVLKKIYGENAKNILGLN